MAKETSYVVFAKRPIFNGSALRISPPTEDKEEGTFPDRIAAFSAAGELAIKENVETYVVKRERVWSDTLVLNCSPAREVVKDA